MQPSIAPENPTQCQSCGRPLRPAARFCPACGKPVSQPAASAAPISSPPPQPTPEALASPAVHPAHPGAFTWKKALLLGCGCLGAVFAVTAVIAILIYGIYNPDAILGLIYTPTPTTTPTATPDYQATADAATQIAKTAAALALYTTQTAQASATAGAKTATAAHQRTQAAATAAASQTQSAATQLAYEATQKVIGELNQAMQDICLGRAEPAAASYSSKRAFHPILISPASYPYPDEARPQELSLLELVACVEESEVTIRSTAYEQNHTCLEKAYVAKITLRAAKTASVVRTNEVRGSNPVRCAYTETFIGLTKTKYGGPIDPTQIWAKIKDLVYLELKP